MEYSKSHTYKTSSCKLSKMNMCSHAQSHVSLHVWYMLSHAASSTSRCAFVYFITQYYTVLQYLYFKPRMSGSKDKSSNEIASTAKTRQTVMIEKKE